jgi:hypothetical protein
MMQTQINLEKILKQIISRGILLKNIVAMIYRFKKNKFQKRYCKILLK